ncbi:hypothetical protein ACFRU3_33875 [Streptomyces sp. NPDC056910]|uniref:hypothetical protein n=1 Tax=Streptomyces sp. NPDC056910 TaxID=3345964 RepID=UPI0036C27377
MNDTQPQGGSIPLEALVVRAIAIAIVFAFAVAVTLTLVAAIADPFHLFGA